MFACQYQMMERLLPVFSNDQPWITYGEHLLAITVSEQFEIRANY